MGKSQSNEEYTDLAATPVFYENYNSDKEVNVNRGGAGSSKCFLPGTEVVMADGRLKKVEDVIEGDFVMGVDSKPKKVLEVHCGFGDLYEVKQSHGISYIVNGDHLLALTRSVQGNYLKKNGSKRYKYYGDSINISVIEYLDMCSQFSSFERTFLGYRKGVDFPHKNVTLDPYFLGLWLGDGDSARACITTADPEIIEYLYKFAESVGLGINVMDKTFHPDGSESKAKSYYLTNGNRIGFGRSNNPITKELKKYGVLNNKHIPDDFLYTDRESRMKLLAGLIDSDGMYHSLSSFSTGNYGIGCSRKHLSEQIYYLVCSLGFRASMIERPTKIKSTGFEGLSWPVNFCGNDLYNIPVKIKRKKAKEITTSVDKTLTMIKVSKKGRGHYIGFSLEGNELFFLKDFTIVHNSHSLAQLILHKLVSEERKKILIVRKTLPSLRNSALILMNELKADYGMTPYIMEERVFLNWYCNGNFLHFGSLDNPEKAKCFHPDTDILTESGWKSIADVVIGEMVATVNPVDRSLHYVPISKTFSYDYKGKMFFPSSESNERSSSLKFCVTPEHKMLASRSNRPFRFVEVSECRVEKYAQHILDFDGKVVDSYTIPKTVDPNTYKKNGKSPVVFPIIPFLKFVGWYLSEGATDGLTNTILCQRKEAGKKIMEEDLKDFPYKYQVEKDRLKFYGKDLARFFASMGRYSGDRFIPRDILELQPELLKHLFKALIDGDGRWGKNGYWLYSTTSKKLADGVSELAFKLGYSVSGWESKTSLGNPSWILSGRLHKDGGSFKVDSVDYEGKVHCVEVFPFHTVVTRYQNSVIISSNSSEWNVIWMEEATDFTWDDYQTLSLRLRSPSRDGIPNRMYLSFNPIDEYHWIKTKLLDDPTQDVKEIISTYKDNPFLPEVYIRKLEALQQQDISFYNIYTLGNWGKLENLIYTNWEIVDYFPNPSSDYREMYGLDFGYNDETAFTHLMIKGNDVFERQLLYRKKMTNGDLISMLPSLMRNRKTVIYADAQEADRIIEIRRAGFHIRPALKNIQDGIDMVKRYHIKVHCDSYDLIKEKRAYSWRKDKNGRILDEPVDFLNHLMDAERYAIYTSRKGGGFNIRVLT